MTGSDILAWNIKTYDDYKVIFFKAKMEGLNQRLIEGYSAKYPEFTVLAVINGGRKWLRDIFF